MRPLSEMTSVERLTTCAPMRFSLAQNFPNPVGRETNIQFSIPLTGFTSLRVFNILGEAIGTIVSEELEAGDFTVRWDASALKCGVYFYRLESGAFSETKKVVVGLAH